MENKQNKAYNIGLGQRITENEMLLIRNTFGGNNGELLKLMRKIFLPEYDVTAPIGQVIDLWFVMPIEGLSDEAIAKNLRERNSLIAHIEARLRDLFQMANSKKGETPEEMIKRLQMDSSK